MVEGELLDMDTSTGEYLPVYQWSLDQVLREDELDEVDQVKRLLEEYDIEAL
jgi:hypothetical protein